MHYFTHAKGLFHTDGRFQLSAHMLMLVFGTKWSLGTHCSWPRPLATTVKHHTDHRWSGPQPPWPLKILSGQKFSLFSIALCCKHILLFRKEDDEHNKWFWWENLSINRIMWTFSMNSLKVPSLSRSRSCGKNNSSFFINLLLVDVYQTCASHSSAEQVWVVTLLWCDLGPHHMLMTSLSSFNPDQLHVQCRKHQNRRGSLPPWGKYKPKQSLCCEFY